MMASPWLPAKKTMISRREWGRWVPVGAVYVAEDRHRWPEENIVALGDGWDTGPDPRRVPDYHTDDGHEDDGW